MVPLVFQSLIHFGQSGLNSIKLSTYITVDMFLPVSYLFLVGACVETGGGSLKLQYKLMETAGLIEHHMVHIDKK